MPAVVEFRPVRPGDAKELAERMREADRQECLAIGHADFEAAVRNSIAASTKCWAIDVDSRLACIFGVAPLGTVLSPTGAPWLLGTDEMQNHRRALVRLPPPYIAEMLGLYPHLMNAVHARNTVAIRWLRRMGFKMHEAVPAPPHGELFHLFEMRA